jgi:hypothetical protein
MMAEIPWDAVVHYKVDDVADWQKIRREAWKALARRPRRPRLPARPQD